MLDGHSICFANIVATATPPKLEMATSYNLEMDSNSSTFAPSEMFSDKNALDSVSVKDRRGKISSLVKQGHFLPEIVSITGFSESAVRRDLRVLGIDISSVSAKLVMTEEEQAVVHLHDQGRSVKEIATENGLAVSRVHYILGKWKTPLERAIDRGKRSSYSPLVEKLLVTHQDDAIRLILSGSTIEDISFVLRLNHDEAQILDSSIRSIILADSNSGGKLLQSYIVELANAGHYSEQIAEASGIGSRIVRKIGRDAGVEGAWLFSDSRAKRIQESVSMLKNGVKLSEIASHFGITREMSRQDFLGAGIDPNEYKKNIIMKISILAQDGKTSSEISEEISIPEERVKRLAHKNDIALKRKTFLFEIHGTVPSYQAGCRCEKCKEANAERARKIREERKDREVPEAVHGTTGGYINWSCRCQGCKEAHALACQKRYNARNGSVRVRTRFSWNREYEDAIMDYSKPAHLLAKEIGATEAAISQRRSKLLRDGVLPRNR